MKVMKRCGNKEDFSVEKIHKVVQWATKGINGVSFSDIEMNANLSLYDGISSSEIHQILIKSANDLSMILLEEKYIVTVSGESFGAPNNIRFSYATSEDVIHKMLDRFKTILSLVK